jgi:uncharacterized oligopeptide transporter (OPT) family protein
MPKVTGSTVVKLIIACFLVGLFLAWFNLDPRDLLTESVRMAKDLANWSVARFGKAMSYIMVGAVVVVPIWLVLYLMRAVRGRK